MSSTFKQFFLSVLKCLISTAMRTKRLSLIVCSFLVALIAKGETHRFLFIFKVSPFPKMSFISSTFCLKCEKIFDIEKRRICTGTCEHSICEVCFDSQTSATCPVCKKENSFNEKSINYQATEIVEKLKNVPITEMLQAKFDPKTHQQGKCFECGAYTRKLRVCAQCSQRSGLLASKSGALELSLDTDDELLETKILRIKSTAVCGDCALEGKHKEHKTVLIQDIKQLEQTSEVLTALSCFTMSMQQAEKEVKDCTYKKLELRVISALEQGLRFTDSLYTWMKDEANEEEGNAFRCLPKFYLELIKFENEYLRKFTDEVVGEVLEEKERGESSKKLTETEIEKTLQKFEQFRGTFAAREGKSELEASDFLDLYKVVRSIPVEYNSSPSYSNFKKGVKTAYQLTKDLRRTLPYKIPKNYANFADSCIQLFLGDTGKASELKIEELD